jgi:TatD DNase family protein
MIKIIDTHTHLDAEEFDEDRAEAFARAREAEVGKVFLPAIDVKTTKAVLSLSNQNPGYRRKRNFPKKIKTRQNQFYRRRSK